MKNISRLLALSSLVGFVSSCNSFLDINQNPNNPTQATPDAILAQALKTTADNYSVGVQSNSTGFSYYGAFVAAQITKSGTVNGYQEERTYTYTSQTQQPLFNNTYNNLYDYQLIETGGKAGGLPYHAAIAEIMKVFNFQLLVDEFGDIPYSQAFQGTANLTPKYDSQVDVYTDLIKQLDQAIGEIQAATATGTARTVGTEDIVFQGNMPNWIRFANSLKLRILLRQSSAPARQDYVKTEMTRLEADADASGGFITGNVVVQPGYAAASGQQNPFWNRFLATEAGNSATERYYTIPTVFVLKQFTDNHDPRVYRLYNAYNPTISGGGPTNGNIFTGGILGTTDPVNTPLGTKASRYRTYGAVFKGADAPEPLMLRADDYFAQAEAQALGFFSGGDAAAKTAFNSGISSSFTFDYTPGPAQRGAASDSSAFVAVKLAKYLAANTTNPLVDWDTDGGVTKQQKIIFQKYLANDGVAAIEAWDDYRRTGFPNIPASTQSTSSRADKLPTRLLYPLNETVTNTANVPTGINQFTTLIFWDPN